ncbi:MAG: glycine zipper domain-containing protein [Polyangiaceae bacterium]
MKTSRPEKAPPKSKDDPTWLASDAGLREGGTLVGALGGAAAGAIVGPVGMLVGGALGTAIGYAVGEAMQSESAVHDAHDKNLDRAIGVTGTSGVGLTEKGKEGIRRALDASEDERVAESRRRVEALDEELEGKEEGES